MDFKIQNSKSSQLRSWRIQNSKSHSPEWWNFKIQNFKISASAQELKLQLFKFQNSKFKISLSGVVEFQNSKFKISLSGAEFQNLTPPELKFKIQNLTLRSWRISKFKKLRENFEKFQKLQENSPENFNSGPNYQKPQDSTLKNFKTQLSKTQGRNPKIMKSWNLCVLPQTPQTDSF